MEEALKKIIKHYGLYNQLKYIHSEYFELDEVIVACEESGELSEYYQDNIAGEIADIMVMLKQFQYYYGISDKQIEDIMNFKIDRQLDRINKEMNKNEQ